MGRPRKDKQTATVVESVFHVHCDLPNASESISGVAFVKKDDGGMVTAEPATPDVVAKFEGITGFKVVLTGAAKAAEVTPDDSGDDAGEADAEPAAVTEVTPEPVAEPTAEPVTTDVATPEAAKTELF